MCPRVPRSEYQVCCLNCPTSGIRATGFMVYEFMLKFKHRAKAHYILGVVGFAVLKTDEITTNVVKSCLEFRVSKMRVLKAYGVDCI